MGCHSHGLPEPTFISDASCNLNIEKCSEIYGELVIIKVRWQIKTARSRAHLNSYQTSEKSKCDKILSSQSNKGK